MISIWVKYEYDVVVQLLTLPFLSPYSLCRFSKSKMSKMRILLRDLRVAMKEISKPGLQKKPKMANHLAI